MADNLDRAMLKRVAQEALRLLAAEEEQQPPPPDPPPTGKTIAFEPADLGTVTETTAGAGAKGQLTIKTSGMPEVAWVVVAGQEPWNWRSLPVRQATTGALNVEPTWLRSGDFVKAYDPTDMAVAKDSPKITVKQAAPPSPTPGNSGAAAIHARFGLGVNQERFTARDHGEARSVSYYKRYRDAGISVVRFFPPFGPTWGIDGSEGSVRPWLEAARACVDSGMPVTIFDCTDVVGYEHMGQRTDDYIRLCGRLIASMNFPTDRFVVGPVNEYAGGTNTAYREHRWRMNGILRAELPRTTLSEGPCCWKHIRALYEPSFIPWGGQPPVGAYEPWPDGNTLQDTHHYEGWDAAGLAGLAQSAQDWCARNGQRMYVGEWGFASADIGSSGNIGAWVQRFDAATDQAAICKARPILWCTTDGSAWPINERGSNKFRPEISSAIPRWASKINRVNGIT